MNSLVVLFTLFLVGIPLCVSAQSYVQPIAWTLGDYDPGNGSLYKTFDFQTVPGVGYALQSSSDLENWTNEQFYYGVGQNISVSLWAEDDFTNPPAPGTVPDPPTYVTLVLRKVTGETGLLVSWLSLDDGGAIQYHLPATNLTPSTAWDSTPLHAETIGDYAYAIANFTMLQPEPALPGNLATNLGALDAALMTAFQTALATINITVGNGYATSQNAPPRPPLPDGSRTFFRLSSDWSLNSDGDHRPDWMEWKNGSGTDALNPDSDGDGLVDGAGPSDDYDNDGIVDVIDALMFDERISWEKTPEGRYIWIPLPAGVGEGRPVALNDNGTVLFEKAIWKNGTWTALNMSAGSSTVSDGTLNWSISGVVHLNNSDEIIGRADLSGFVESPDVREGTIYWSSPNSAPQLVGSSVWAKDTEIEGLAPGGIAGNGSVFTVQTPVPTATNFDHKGLAFDGAGGLLLELPDDESLSYIADVSLQGSVLGGLATGYIDTNGFFQLSYDTFAWKNENPHQLVASFNEENLYRHLTQFSNDRIALTGSNSVPLLEDNSGSLGISPNLLGAALLSSDGTAFKADADGSVSIWRNGEERPLADLCEKVGELIGQGYDIAGIDINDDGTILIEATDDLGNSTVGLCLPVSVEVPEVLFGNQTGRFQQAEKLRVAKWEKEINSVNEEPQPGWSYTIPFTGHDDDRFYVRVPDYPASLEVHLKTYTHDWEAAPGPTIDDETELIWEPMASRPGWRTTHSNLLVVGDVDDDFTTSPTIVADDLPGDRTHKVNGKGLVRLSLKANQPSLDERIYLPTKADYFSRIDQMIIIPDADGTIPFNATVADTWFKEKVSPRFFQTNIDLKVDSTYVASIRPPGMRSTSGCYFPFGPHEYTDMNAVIAALGTDSIDDLQAFSFTEITRDVVVNLGDGMAQLIAIPVGLSVIRGDEASPTTAHTNTVWFHPYFVLHGDIQVYQDKVILAHELAHVLTNGGHYVSDINILNAAAKQHNAVDDFFGHLRFSEDQEKAMHESPFVNKYSN